MVQTTKRAVNRAWDVAGFRAAMAANIELDVMIETANLPARGVRTMFSPSPSEPSSTPSTSVAWMASA